jgi:hypothetical protein
MVAEENQVAIVQEEPGFPANNRLEQIGLLRVGKPPRENFQLTLARQPRQFLRVRLTNEQLSHRARLGYEVNQMEVSTHACAERSASASPRH